MPASHLPHTLHLDPPAATWRSLVRPTPNDPTTRDTRAALGLPADRPVIMAGHQPGFWHPGILAKWLATHALARRAGGAGAWVVVDQSPGAGATLDYPAQRGQRLARGTITLGSADSPPASQRPARFDAPTDAALPAVADALARIADALDTLDGEPSLAHQLHAACASALADRAQLRPCFASDLHTTPAFAELVGAMRADPAACARLYNQAAAAHPSAGVRPLALTAHAVELPLWERSASPGPWRTVTSARLPDLPDHALVPRGLPMTGLLRRRACDLFIHGTGGGASHADEGYDRATERWFADWLGATHLAHAVVASATLRLDFGGLVAGVPTPEEIARARGLAHRASHDPSLLGDAPLGQRKRGLAEHITALPRGSPVRATLFAQMLALRDAARHSNADRLARLRARADALAARAGEADLAADRAWAWPFHPARAIDSLGEQVAAALDRPG